jgi:HSP20 family protein
MANVIQYNPFRDLFNWRNDAARLLGFTAPFPVFQGDGETLAAGWTPAVDIYEDSEGITLKADVAGIDPKDVDVKIENGILTMKGERKLEKEDKKDNYTRVERYYGAFTRSFTIPPQVDTAKVIAETKHGVLKVFLPKAPEAKPKQIQVKVS